MKSVALAALFLFPFAASAEVRITEIMYDPAGTEAGGDRDWVELHNDGTETVAIKAGSSNDSWRLYEKNSSTGTEHNRTFSGTPFQGDSLSLAPGEYVVVAKSGGGFTSDYPAYAGKIFIVSAMSLTNTGRTLGLRIGSQGEIWSSVTYASDQGAYDDGNSLQLANDSWIPAAP